MIPILFDKPTANCTFAVFVEPYLRINDHLRQFLSSQNEDSESLPLPLVIRLFSVRVIEVEVREVVSPGRNDDDSWIRGTLESRKNRVGEDEGTQVVRSELHLESIGREGTFGESHDTCVVDQSEGK